MKILCAVDGHGCGDGASGPCMAQHPDKCVCKYIETATKTVRKPKKQKNDYYEEETEEPTWRL